MTSNPTDHLPLSPATMHVLLALSNGDLHGYGILLEVARQSGGIYKIGPGTLYDNLKKLLGEGLVDEASNKTEIRDSRREYRITPFGCDVLRAETERLALVIRAARRSVVVQEPASIDALSQQFVNNSYAFPKGNRI